MRHRRASRHSALRASTWSGLVAILPVVLATGALGAWAAAASEKVSTQPSAPVLGPAASVAETLDAFHAAAAAADEQGYLGLFAPEGIFLGTAAGERWTVDAFRTFVHPYFSKGTGWRYTPRPGGRHINLNTDGSLAWFDEVLDNAKYGECRGTGALRIVDGKWRIVQYNLMIPIPNEIAPKVVEMIRAAGAGP